MLQHQNPPKPAEKVKLGPILIDSAPKEIVQQNTNKSVIHAVEEPAVVPSAPPMATSLQSASAPVEAVTHIHIHISSTTIHNPLSFSPSISSPQPSSGYLPARIPDEFLCPISRDIMVDPVITTAGQTYERQCIEEWFQLHNTDPLSHIPIMKILTPNIALKQQIAKFHAGYQMIDPTCLVGGDRSLAMQLRIEELALSLEAKAARLDSMGRTLADHSASIESLKVTLENLETNVADMEKDILNSIPENLSEVLSRLESSSDELGRSGARELSEKKIIQSSEEMLSYYVSMQVMLNGCFMACSVIISEMVKTQVNSNSATLGGVLHAVSGHVAFFPGASVGFEVIAFTLKRVAENEQRKGVERVLEIFRGDTRLMSTVAEAVARGMTLFRRPLLESHAAKEAKRREPGYKSSKKIKDALKTAMTACLNKGETNFNKLKANEDASDLISTLMGGRTFRLRGTSSAQEIAEAFLDYLFTI